MLINMTGEKYGRLTVIKHNENGGSFWDCLCECGNFVTVSRQSLISQNTRSCGCLHREVCRNRSKDIENHRFGRLVAKYRSDNINKRNVHWVCECDCGAEVVVDIASLNHGVTKSCGCLQKDIARRSMIPNGGAAKNKLYGQYKQKAKKRGIDFRLTKGQFLKITQKS